MTAATPTTPPIRVSKEAVRAATTSGRTLSSGTPLRMGSDRSQGPNLGETCPQHGVRSFRLVIRQ